MNFLCLNAGRRQTTTALLAAAGAVAIILSVLGFQHIGGYIPCYLCYLQREPYYIAIPVLLIAGWASSQDWPSAIPRGLLAIGTLCFAGTAAMGIYHSGVEWNLWAGPTDCGVAVQVETKNALDLLNQLQAIKPPRCNEAAGRFLGLSFAGWNVVVAIIMSIFTALGTFARNK